MSLREMRTHKRLRIRAFKNPSRPTVSYTTCLLKRTASKAGRVTTRLRVGSESSMAADRVLFIQRSREQRKTACPPGDRLSVCLRTWRNESAVRAEYSQLRTCASLGIRFPVSGPLVVLT